MHTTNSILVQLRKNPGSNLRAIEDLTKFRERSQIFAVHVDDATCFAYLLISGHPSTAGKSPTVILGGNAAHAVELTKHLPQSPYTILETPSEFLKVLEGKLPTGSKTFLERRMELQRQSFKNEIDTSRVRQLKETDDAALAEFYGAPPQAAAGMRNWIRGATYLVGIFEESKLIAMGSTFCAVPEGWSLVSIKTRSDYRRKGYSAAITSALCKKAFDNVGIVELTVVSDNAPAIALYKKLGFELKEERVWIDCGSGADPNF